MAAVTVNSSKFNVDGSLRQNFYNIGGNSGDTLVVGMFTVRKVNFDPSVITSVAVATNTPDVGFNTLTFTGGPFTNTNVEVLGN